MKKLTILLCLFLTVTALYARAIQEDYRKAEENARISYAFGMAIAANLDLSSLGIEFDYTAFADGLKAVLEPDVMPQLSENEAMEIVETAYYNAMERIAEEYRIREEAFLSMNSLMTGIITTKSGLQYEKITETAGEKPEYSSTVRVHYTGSFTDGSIFDYSYEEDGAYIPLSGVITGWTEGVMLMSPGSVYKLYIPSHLAYGKDGIQGVVPPYSTLIFTVELLEILGDDYYPYYDPYDYYNYYDYWE